MNRPYEYFRFVIYYYVLFGGIVTLYIHGHRVVVMYALLLLNFGISKLFINDAQHMTRAQVGVALTWAYNLIIVWSCYDDHWSRVLWKGTDRDHVMMEWCSNYRFMILKCISFNMDRYYALKSRRRESGEGRDIGANDSNKLYRSCFEMRYLQWQSGYDNVWCYMGYMLYMPLYFAGPIISYHDWLAQIQSHFLQFQFHNKQQHSSFVYDYVRDKHLHWKSIMVYVMKLLCAWLVFEVMLHHLYLFNLSKYAYGYAGGSSINMYASNDKHKKTLAVFMHLFVTHALWLKFYIIWRFYRSIACMDGMYTIENMQRCAHHNHSVLGFWKYWHTSFNHWNMKYMFIPLGGSRSSVFIGQRVLNIALVFVFTCTWHGDFNSSLFSWAALMVALTALELLGTWVYWTVIAPLFDSLR